MNSHRTQLCLVALLAILGATHCAMDIEDTGDLCNDDPAIAHCPAGQCLSSEPYPCISYCLEHHSLGEPIPQSGPGSWCDDFEPSFDYADFCDDHTDLAVCRSWCQANPGLCAAPSCGDGECGSDETALDCPDDCDSICGDGFCSHDETALSCADDCAADCGDGYCTADEDPLSCMADCPADCGDGACTHDETALSCDGDCTSSCGDGACTHDESSASCPDDCPESCGDGECDHDETALSCPDDCPALCRDSACTHDEDAGSCPDDCPPACGDGSCTHSESATTCPDDCPAVCGDGFVTHDEECEGCSTAACTTSCGSRGTRSCSDCAWSDHCSPPHETCNGEDDDCDGSADNGFECAAGLDRASCTTSCGSEGAMVCNAACGWPATCTPPSEGCNGFDDDCDGTVDESCGCRSRWSEVISAPRVFNGVWGSDWNDVVVVGSSIGGHSVRHFDGSSWDTYSLVHGLEAPTLTAVWGSSASDLFVVGLDGHIFRGDGTGWSHMSSGTSADLEGVWGSAPDDVFVVGEGGFISHYNGFRWTHQSSGTVRNLYAVWGSASDDVWAVGDRGTILHYDGRRWSDAGYGGTAGLRAVWGRSERDIFVGGVNVILHSMGSGSAWDELPIFEVVTDIWGGSESWQDLFATTTAGTVQRYSGISSILYDAGNWSELPSFTTGSLYAIWGSSTENVFAVGNDAYQRCGTGW